MEKITKAYCMRCNNWKDVIIMELYSHDIQFCSDCLCEMAIYLDPRISFKLNKKKSIIKFNWQDMKWTGITIEQVKIWEKLYPYIDVIWQLNTNMIGWLDRNRDKKKAQKTQWKDFITGWLKKENMNAIMMRG